MSSNIAVGVGGQPNNPANANNLADGNDPASAPDPIQRLADHSTGRKIGQIVLASIGGFAAGALWGVIARTPVVFTATVFAVDRAVATVFTYALAHIGRALQWTNEGTKLFSDVSETLVAVGLLVGGIAFGIFGTIGIVIISIGLAGNLYAMVQAARAYNALPKPAAASAGTAVAQT